MSILYQDDKFTFYEEEPTYIDRQGNRIPAPPAEEKPVPQNPELEALRQEIQTLKEEGQSLGTVITGIEDDDTIKDKESAIQIAIEIYAVTGSDTKEER